jgi:hypothetical protein
MDDPSASAAPAAAAAQPIPAAADASGAPHPLELAPLVGLDPALPLAAEPLPARHGHALWRIRTPERSYVLKWLPEGPAATELEAYQLLTALGVPTLPVYGLGGQALLLEDLAASDAWRLATAADVERAEVGSALARWYRALHEEGSRGLAAGRRPAFLAREIDRLHAGSVLALGVALGIGEERLWRLAAEHVERLKAAVDRLHQTLNYNDFHWTNLSISRPAPGARLEAVVFDYHLFGLGLRASDVRNVTSSLAGDAASAFAAGYGDLDPREAVLDAPLATLFDLRMAVGPPLARWAEGSLARVASGRFEHELRAAIALCDAERWG